MKGLNKILLVVAVAAPFAAQAELKSIDDAAMADVSGQSGLVIEAGFGTTGRTGYFDADWTTAGIKIDAFKWEVDVETYENSNNSAVGLQNPTVEAALGGAIKGGFIARDIAIAGYLDVTIDAVGDVSALGAASVAGAYDGTEGGIGITFAGSKIDFRVGDMGVYVGDVAATGLGGPADLAAAQISSFGGIEILGLDINGLDLVVRGNGLAR